MNMTQVYELVNETTREILGEEAIVNEDLSNIVDIGKSIENLNKVDNYVGKILNKVGRMIFKDKTYEGNYRGLMMDAWEYGSITEKIRMELPEAEENESWELSDGASYDPYIFRKPIISAKYFNDRVTFEVDISVTDKQAKESFNTPVQQAAFVTMIYNTVRNSIQIKMESLAQRTINNLIASTVQDDYNGASLSAASHIKAINLLKLYNDQFNEVLTFPECLTDDAFIRFAAYTMKLTAKRMSAPSKLFNITGCDNFTRASDLKVIMLEDFSAAAEIYLYSSTFHENLVKLPAADTVPYWQASGTDYSDNAEINVKTSAGDTVTVTGLLACMFDRAAAGISNLEQRTRTAYSEKGEFLNSFYKNEAGYFNDFDENAVVFFAA